MIRRLLIELDTYDPALASIHEDFPSLAIVRATPVAPIEPSSRMDVVDAEAWSAGASVSRAPFDDALGAASASGGLRLRGTSPSTVGLACWEILTAYQRHLGRRNAASRGVLFDEVLHVHAALHGGGQQQGDAELHHAIDVWQWLLRLRPSASLAAQLAALFPDPATTRAALALLAVEPAEVDRACALIERREAGGPDEELAALVDADALSFFSLDSPGHVDRLGPEKARSRITWTLARLAPARRPLLRRVRLRRDVRALVDGALPRSEGADA